MGEIIVLIEVEWEVISSKQHTYPPTHHALMSPIAFVIHPGGGKSMREKIRKVEMEMQ